MLSQEFFTNYPSRFLWAGGGLLCSYAFIAGALLLPVADQPVFPLPPRKSIETASSQAIPSLLLDGRDHRTLWKLPPIEDDVLISFSPSRPGMESRQPMVHVRLKGAQESRRIALPSRIYLKFNDRGILHFQESEGPFWMDLNLESDGLKAQITVMNRGDAVYQASFSRSADAPPLQKGEEFPSGTALRSLGEAHWWGADLVSQLGSCDIKQRIDIGSATFEIGENEWICFKDGRWSKISGLPDDTDCPVARIRTVSAQMLEWDVWDDASYVRLGCSPQTVPGIQKKTEEWLNSVRIRSDKQISCMLEKQCFILRAGDWVLKENGRWRVVRKSEDKQKLLAGNKTGELFVLEKIDSRQKNIKGRLFLANRTQSVPVEVSSSNAKPDKKRPQRIIRTNQGKSA
jgi:hypothetical protein